MAAAFSHLLNPHPLRSVFQRVPSRREFIVLFPSHGRRQYVKFAFLFSCSNLKFFSKIWRVNRVFKLPARHRVGLLARLTGGVKRRVISANGGREGVQSFDRRRCRRRRRPLRAVSPTVRRKCEWSSRWNECLSRARQCAAR